MKTKIHIGIGALLAVALFVVTLPISSAAQERQRRERTHIKHGLEVGKRTRELRNFNPNVGRALGLFEWNARRNGHSPKHDESFSVTLDPERGSAKLNRTIAPPSPFRKVGFKPQTDYSGYGIEMIFIPTYEVPGEWQGTVVINKFDPSGAYLGDYVADVVMVPDPTYTFWDVIYEVSFSDGQAYLQYGDPSFDPGTLGSGGISGISTVLRPDFQKVSFEPPQGINWEGRRPGPIRGGNGVGPKTRQTMKCTAAGSAGAGVTCGLASIPAAGVPWLPCMGVAVPGVFTTCAIAAIFGWG